MYGNLLVWGCLQYCPTCSYKPWLLRYLGLKPTTFYSVNRLAVSYARHVDIFFTHSFRIFFLRVRIDFKIPHVRNYLYLGYDTTLLTKLNKYIVTMVIYLADIWNPYPNGFRPIWVDKTITLARVTFYYLQSQCKTKFIS